MELTFTQNDNYNSSTMYKLTQHTTSYIYISSSKALSQNSNLGKELLSLIFMKYGK